MTEQTAFVSIGEREIAAEPEVPATLAAGAGPASAPARRADQPRWLAWLRLGRTPIRHGAFVVALVLLWSYASRHWLDPLVLPSPSAVWSQFYDQTKSGYLPHQAWSTVQAMLIGFGIGATAAFLLSILLTGALSVGRFIEPYLIAFDAIPMIAIVPVLVAWFGFGLQAKIAMAIFAAFFIVFITSFQGLRTTDPRYLELARILQAGKVRTIFEIRIWAALPFFASAVKLALPRTAFAVVISEFLGSNQGLGYVITSSQSLLNTAGLLAAVLTLTLIVQILSRLARLLEIWALRWVPKEKK